MAGERDPWAAAVLPDGGDAAATLRALVRFAVLAPSGHNSQPWAFRVSDGALDGAVDVFADRSRALPIVDPDDRELTISCGAALGAMEVAMRRAGHAGAVTLLTTADEPDHLARLALGAPHAPTAEDVALAGAIPVRRTNRKAYSGEPVPPALLARCRQAAGPSGVRIAVCETADARQTLAGLVAEADRAQMADPAFRRELARWVKSHRLGSRDGLSGANFGLPDRLSPLGALVVRHVDMGKAVAARDAKTVMESSPTLALLSTDGDDPIAWLETGRALMRCLLLLTAEGYSAAYLNQPVELPRLRPQVAAAFREAGAAQLLLRIGRAEPVSPAARRPAEAVMKGA